MTADDRRQTADSRHQRPDGLKTASLIMPSAEFTVPAQDSHGHSARVSFRIPPGMMRELGIIMQEREKFGWETDSDFYRWAVRFGMDKASEFVTSRLISNVSSINRAILNAWQEEKAMSNFHESIMSVQEAITALQRTSGTEKRIMGLIQDTLREVEGMDDAFWRTKWRDEVKIRFGHYIRTARLTGVENDDD